MRYGIWRIDDLLTAWRTYVQAKDHWQIHEYEGYRPISADITTFGTRARVSEVLNRKRPLTLNMIRKLQDGLGIPAEVLVQPYPLAA